MTLDIAVSTFGAPPYSDRLEEIVRSGGKDWTVELVPNVGHIQLILEPAAIAAIGLTHPACSARRAAGA